MRFSARSIVALSTVAFLLTSSPRAYADEWYGYQTLAVDCAAATLLVAGIAGPRPVRKVFLPLSLVTYLVASPVVHTAHQRGDVGVGALGLRIVAPVALGVVGLLVGASGRDSSWGAPLVGGFIGVTLGVITAVVIDAAALARETQKPVGQMATSLSLGPSVFVPFGGVF